MLRYTALAGLMLVPLTAAAAAPPLVKAEQDGYKFEYTTALVDGNKVVFNGRFFDPKEDFVLVVDRDGWAHGEFGGSPVEFKVDHKQHQQLLAEVAAEQNVKVAEAGTGK
jgi:hypothetical protein